MGKISPGQRHLRQLDLLRIAALTLHFYGTPGYCELEARGQKTGWTLDAARKLMAFPTDFQTRFLQEEPSAFGLEEIAFIFVARVRCYVHSEDLAHIGCVVTDCPGLLASAWDTSVAMNAMSNADGIWFLIDGGREMGAATIDLIRSISRRKWGHKLFFQR